MRTNAPSAAGDAEGNASDGRREQRCDCEKTLREWTWFVFPVGSGLAGGCPIKTVECCSLQVLALSSRVKVRATNLAGEESAVDNGWRRSPKIAGDDSPEGDELNDQITFQIRCRRGPSSCTSLMFAFRFKNGVTAEQKNHCVTEIRRKDQKDEIQEACRNPGSGLNISPRAARL